MLAVGIHENNHLAGSSPCAGFDGSTIAFAIGVVQNPRTCGACHAGGVVAGAIVHDDDFCAGALHPQLLEGLPNRSAFVLGGQNDANFHFFPAREVCAPNLSRTNGGVELRCAAAGRFCRECIEWQRYANDAADNIRHEIQ